MKAFLQLFLITSLTALSAPVLSQAVRGQVQDADGAPLPFVSVLLLNGSDSSLVKGALTDATGSYRIDQVARGSYIMTATMLGYRQAYMPPVIINDKQEEVEVSVMSLTPDARLLHEVAVTAKRPFVEQLMDRTIVNVANSIIASGSTALEVLEKAPGVTVDRQNDQIQLRGRNGVIVQIDGRQTYLEMADVVSLLRSMSSDNIDQIELITNPSARYDAAGNAGIINIRLKKNNNIGTNGSLSLAGGSGRYDRERASLQLNHRSPKLNLFGNYSANRGGNHWDFMNYRNQADGEQRNIIDQKSYFRMWDWGQNAKAGADYLVSKNTTLGLVWTGFWVNNRERGPAAATFQRQEGGPVYVQTQTDKSQQTVSFNQIVNLNLQHTFGRKGGQVSVDLDLGHFNRSFTNTLLTETLLTQEAQPLMGLLNQMPTTLTIQTAKADYSRKVGKGWNMETGLKNSLVTSDNNLAISSGQLGKLLPDPVLSNHFQYREQIQAAYLNFSGKLDAKTEVQAGLRVEKTHSIGHSLSLNQKVTRDYLDLFPSLFISRSLSANQSLTVSYSHRIDRPNYQRLNPAPSFADPYTYSRGNAFLRPQYTQVVELKHSYKSVTTSLGTSFTRDFVFFTIQPIDSVRIEGVPENIGKYQAYNLTVSFPVAVTKSWVLQTTFMGLYSQFQYEYMGDPHEAQQFSGRVNASNAITIGGGWTAELSGWLNTPAVEAMVRMPWLGSLDLGVQKTLNSRWKVKGSLQDVFRTNRMQKLIQTPDFSTVVRYSLDTRVALLNLTYTFGNQQLKGIRQRRIGSEEESKRAN